MSRDRRKWKPLFAKGDKERKTKRTYSQFLPKDSNSTAQEEFGWLPLSVFKPERREDWRNIIGDEGDEKSRRSKDAKYLPNLRFSEFHPHLAEVVIRYWSMEGDLVVDPFAGRATRGIVALTLKRKYQGYEVAPKTFAKTLDKISEMGGRLKCSDGCAMRHTTDKSADLVFTCPPYHRLERYEPAHHQLSELKSYDDFLDQIKICAKNIYRVLKPGKFLCWVCGDWRDGNYRLFHADSLRIFQKAGLTPHDIIIIQNNSPFARLQVGKVVAKRYTSKAHEYLLVFRKPT